LRAGVIGVEALRQKALERSVPDVAHVPRADLAAGLGGRFEQLRLRHQGAHLPALALLLERDGSRAQPFALVQHFSVLDEIPLMQVVERLQEELQGSRFLGENQAAFLFRDGIVVHQLRERAAGNRIAPDIA
jgi:hypothetical protein